MEMKEKKGECIRRESNRGAWTSEEDQRLAQEIEIHGPRRWKSVAAKAGLNRCGKSCRLRWMNYLRPNIKRGNISAQEEDLILRLHKLLGNRWSLIAGRLPGRTDNEIKNYWNSHLSKRKKQNEKQSKGPKEQEHQAIEVMETTMLETKTRREDTARGDQEESKSAAITRDNLFGCSSEGPLNLDWMSQFLEMDESWFDIFL